MALEAPGQFLLDFLIQFIWKINVTGPRKLQMGKNGVNLGLHILGRVMRKPFSMHFTPICLTQDPPNTDVRQYISM